MNDFQLLIAGSSPAMCIEKEKWAWREDDILV